MWSLLLDFLSSIFVEWRLWKWIHDPPLKGDRPREAAKRMSKKQPSQQPPNFKATFAVTLIVLFVLAILIWIAVVMPPLIQR